MYENPDLAASNFVKGVDTAFVIIYAVSIFFLVAITVTMIYFVFRYNNKRNPKATQIKGMLLPLRLRHACGSLILFIQTGNAKKI
jgi:heme/copper-type cytochrome/quinol oxidase subunit 2